MGLIRYFVKKSILVNLVAVFITLIGFFMFFTSAKEVFPNIQMGYIVITTVYPQAGSEEVEKLVTIPIENAIEDVDGIDKITSWTSEGMSMIGIELVADANIKEALDDIEKAVDAISDLPDEAMDPNVFEIASDIFPVINVSVSGGKDYAQLREASKRLEERLLEVKGVGEIEMWGYYDKALWIDVDKNELDRYGLTLFNFISTLQDRDISMPAGNKTFDRYEYAVRFLSPMDSKEDVENVILRSNDAGRKLQVKNVAEVIDGFQDEDMYLRSQGQRAVLFDVLKNQGKDSIKIAKQVREIALNLEKEFNGDIKVSFSNDMSIYLQDRLDVLYSNGAFGALLVVGMLMLLLRPSIAVFTALGLPVAFGISFFATNQLGISFNMMSIFGFIMVLGMLVDDAIVVGENVYRHMEMGKDTYNAVVDGTSEMIMPVIASVSTTIAAFSPLMMIGGMMGEFLSAIPKVIIIALAASVIECFFILPSHLADFVKQKTRGKGEQLQEHWFEVLKEKYGKLLEISLYKRGTTAVLIALMFIFGIGLEMRNGFSFTDSQVNEIEIKLKTNKEFSVDDTERIVKDIEKIVLELDPKDLEAVNSFVGMWNSTNGPPTFAPNIGNIAVILHIEDNRKTKDANKILETLRNRIGMPEGVKTLDIKVVKGGPPSGEEIDVAISADSFDRAVAVSEEFMEAVKKINFADTKKDSAAFYNPVASLNTDFEEGKKELRFVVDEAKASRAGVNLTQASIIMRSAIAGFKLKTIKKLGEDIEVKVRVNEQSIATIDDVLQLKVPNMMGNRILLREIVKVEQGTTYSQLKHIDGKKSVSVIGTLKKPVKKDKGESNVVKAEADKTEKTKIKKEPNINVNFFNMKMKGVIKEFEEKYKDVRFETGGEQEAMAEGFQDLGKAFVVALFLIFIILATLFNSLVQPFIIMLAIPFGFIGVMWTLVFHGMSISFMAFMAFVGLTGVVVNNSLIMVSFINGLIAEGKSFEHAIIEGSKTRLRPIVLTTFTTVIGLMPLGYGWFGGNDPMITPMAVVFAWGLLFASFVTLFIIPSFMVTVNNLKISIKRKLGKGGEEKKAFSKKESSQKIS
ncbi:MAG: hypothetical protein CVV21_07610 [Candidatus Goldiibacteriota bacterium HGW-Goldbacteria-1]|jgi:multidrug efflux pump subunit AcrB|nr:MAG: hypothetical protein CVV21_07610 [Candidatus Goldiibacteriota bacterium HGW-Goldbacteria-1]